MKTDPLPCACGCGLLTSGRLWKGLPVRYVRGHGPHYAHPPGQRIPDAELLADLQRLKTLLNRNPTQADLKLYGNYSTATYYAHFGDWRSVLKAANLPTCLDWSVSLLRPEDGGWLAGFIAGEGCFQIRKSQSKMSVALAIRLRRDDESSLHEIKILWSLGNRFLETTNPRHIEIVIADIETCFHKIVPTFDRYILRGRKGQDFQIWKAAASLLHEFLIMHPINSKMPDSLQDDLLRLRLASQEIKVFQADFVQVLSKHKIAHLVSQPS
jgi:hypothetical protein